MRTAVYVLAALLAPPVHAEPPRAVDGDVVRLYVRDTHSRQIFVERATPGAGWADMRVATALQSLRPGMIVGEVQAGAPLRLVGR